MYELYVLSQPQVEALEFEKQESKLKQLLFE